MTPERRFDQIDQALTDVVQKVDRLIEANGQIITEVSKIPGTGRTVSITAKGLIDLTTNVNKRFDLLQQDVNQQFEGIDQRFDQLQQEVSDVKEGQQLILQILREKLG